MSSERRESFVVLLTLDLPDQKLTRYRNHKALFKIKTLNGFINTVSSHQASGRQLYCTLASKKVLSWEQRSRESLLQNCCCHQYTQCHDTAGNHCLHLLGVQEPVPFSDGKQGLTLDALFRDAACVSSRLSSGTAVSTCCPVATRFVYIIGAGSLIFNRAVTPVLSGDHLLFRLSFTKLGVSFNLYMHWGVGLNLNCILRSQNKSQISLSAYWLMIRITNLQQCYSGHLCRGR